MDEVIKAAVIGFVFVIQLVNTRILEGRIEVLENSIKKSIILGGYSE